MEKFDDHPPRGFWTSTQRHEYDGYMAQLITKMRPIREKLEENADKIMTQSGFDQMQLAIDAGILTVESSLSIAMCSKSRTR